MPLQQNQEQKGTTEKAQMYIFIHLSMLLNMLKSLSKSFSIGGLIELIFWRLFSHRRKNSHPETDDLFLISGRNLYVRVSHVAK